MKYSVEITDTAFKLIRAQARYITIDEPAKKVWVIGFRHGSRLPRPNELPDVLPEC